MASAGLPEVLPDMPQKKGGGNELPDMPKKGGGAGSPHDFTNGYTPTASDKSTKDSFDGLSHGFDKSTGGQNSSQVSPLPKGVGTELPFGNGTPPQYIPVTDPVLKKQLQDKDQKAADRAAMEDMHQKVTAHNNAVTYYNALNPDEQSHLDKINNISLNIHKMDSIRATTPEEVEQMKAMDTTWGKVKKGITYVASEGMKGGVDVLKGSAWVLNHLNTGLADTQLIPDTAWQGMDKFTDLGITPGQKDEIENSKSMGWGATRTLGMLANIAPAAVGGEAADIPKTMFALQGFGQGVDTMNQVDPERKLNPAVRDLYIAGSGAVNGLIMGDLKENVLSKSVQDKIVSGIVSEGLQEATEKGLTENTFKSAIKKTTKNFNEKAEQLIFTYAEKTGQAAKDFSALNAANYVLKKGVDLTSDQPVFNANLGDLMSQISDVVTKQAPIFGGIGTMLKGGKEAETEKQKYDLGQQIAAKDAEIAQLSEKTGDPVKSAENEVSLEQAEKDREELNNQLKTVIVKQRANPKQVKPAVKDELPEAPAEVPAQGADEEPANNQVNVKPQENEKNDDAQKRGQEKTDAGKAEGGKKSTEEVLTNGAEKAPLKTEEAEKGKILPNKEIKANQKLASNEVSEKYGLKASDGEILFSQFKDVNPFDPFEHHDEKDNILKGRTINSINIEDVPPMLKGAYKSLEATGYLHEYDDNYYLSEDGKKYIDAVKSRLETRKGIKAGTDLFPHDAGLKPGEFKKEHLAPEEHIEANDLLSDHGLTIKDIEDEQQERNAGGETTAPADADEKGVQQPANDGAGDAGKTGSGKTAQSGKSTPENEKSAVKAGDPLRDFANKVRNGKISKLTGFRSSTLFDKAWDGSLEAVALAIDGGAKLADAIEAGLKHIRKSDWYKSATDKKGFEAQYKAHLTKEYEARPELPQESALNKAAVSENRQIIGKDGIDKPEKLDLDSEYRKAVEKVDSGALQPLEIAQRIIDKRETPTIEEFNALLYHNRKIDNSYDKAQSRVDEAEKSGDADELNSARNALIVLDRAKDLLHTAARNVSYNWGFMGRLLQEAVKKDYSLSALRRLFRAKSGDGKIPEDIDKLITQYAKERDEALKKLQDYQDKEAERSAQKEVDRQKKQQGRILQGAKLDKAIDDTFKSISDKLRAQRATLSMNPIPVEALPEIAKLVGYYTQKGILKASQVAENIYHKLKDDIDGLTMRDVIDAIAGNGYEKETKTANQLTKDRAEIKRQAKLIARLEDIESGRVKPSILRSKAKISEEAQRLREQIKKTAVDLGLPLKNHKEYLKAKLAEIEQKLQNGDYSKKPKANRIEPDNEVLRLRAQIRRAETRIDELGANLDQRREHAVKKVLDGYTKIHRLFVLSRVGTLAKLTSAAAGRAITTPIEEVLGSINAILPGFRKIAERSPRYSKGFRISDEVKAITTHFTAKQWKQNLQILKEGHGDLDYLFDPKAYKEDGDVAGFPGRMHGMLKNSTKTAEFERSFSHILQWEKDNNPNIDINDEATQERIGKEAMKLAQRSIFMNDNMAVDLYKDIITIAEKKWGNTGTAIATVMRALMPIVKIPTNFALEATDIATLGARSVPTIIKAVARGAESLSPKEADFVMRMMRKGEMGFAMMAVAYFNPENFGGYYIKGEKRDKKDLQEGDLKIFGVKIPHLLQHWPLISAMQAAATLRRTQDYYLSKGKEGGTRAGILNGFKGIYENVPFLELPGQITKALESDNATNQFVGQIAKNQMVPGLIQEVAEQTDTKDKSLVTINPDNVVKRKPDSKSGMLRAIQENVMTGIPGWREMIAEKPEAVDKATPVIKLMDGSELHLNDKQVQERKQINDDYIKQHGPALTRRFTAEAKMSKKVKETIKKLSSFWKEHGVPQAKQEEYKQRIIDAFIKKHIQETAEKHSKPIMLRKYKKADGSYDFQKEE